MRIYKFLISVCCIFISIYSYATHIRAGEITAVQINGLTFEFTFTGYRDVDGVLFGNGIFDFGDGTIFGGTDGETIPWETPVNVGNGVERWRFSVRHTYSAGAPYLVSYTEDFRNEDIQNIAGSVSTSFHVETLVVVDQLIANSTPFFTVPPIDQGVVGAVFEHDPGAFDPDDDSLVFYFTTPQQASDLDVGGYRTLIDASYYDDFNTGNAQKNGPPTLSIDPVEGILIWDAPGGATIPDMQCREWNVAFVVEEWRVIRGQPIRLGFVTRDMQIIVCDYENEPPELVLPEDTCVVAGQSISAIIRGTDPDGDPVKLEAFGGPFEISPGATYTPDPPNFQEVPASLLFNWNTSCNVVRESPYEVQFKATDSPTIPGIGSAPGQSNFETWRITVVGPPPEGLEVDGVPGRRMNLSWSSYSCTNADSIQIWRRVGEFDIDTNCNPGIPETAGYELIQIQSISDTTFVDNNNGLGLSSGSKYCYRLVATFPSPEGGLSIASEEACDSLIIDAPVITKVDITSTSESNGTISVQWTPPIDRDAAFGPYTYEVLRKQGMGLDGGFTSVRVPSPDTTFNDTGLNTKDLAYSYKIILYDNLDEPIDSSLQASTVRLNPNSKIGAIELEWDANVPWSNTNQSFPNHLIYRDNVLTNSPETLVLIDEVDVTINGFRYLDDGRFNNISLDDEIEYCYFVTTRGSYDNEKLPEPLINNSQIICAQPADSIPPCSPLSITFASPNNFNCEAQFICDDEDQQLQNVLNWESDNAPECDDDIAFFRVYVSESADTASFSILGTTTGNEFIHLTNNLDPNHNRLNLRNNSLAFCYYITAVDRSGNESQISEIICNDNCPQYVLPNVFTPNGDMLNDTFRPLQQDGQCPRFVESVIFKVFSRTGVELFSYNSKAVREGGEGEASARNSIYIDWNGTSDSGKELPAGVYYYSAEVKFITLNPKDRVQVIKGWIQLLR